MAFKKGNTAAQKWTPAKRKILVKKLLEAASDEENPEYTIKQICYRAGTPYTVAEDLIHYYKDVSDAWCEIKAILQKRWLKLAMKGEGHANVVRQFLDYHSTEVTKHFDDREVTQIERIEKAKTNERIREKKALAEQVNDGNANVLDDFHEFLEWKAKYKKNQ